MAKKYVVTLAVQEREELTRLVSVGTGAARRLTHARVLLMADASPGAPARKDQDVAGALSVSVKTIERLRQRFVEQGLEAALVPAKSTRVYEQAGWPAGGATDRPGLQQTAGGEEALDAAAAGRRTGRAGGRRLAVVRDGAADAEKNEIKPHLKKMWCIPPQQSGAFVYHMEDVLEVYHRPYDQKRPVVCLDETFKQLIGETREPLPPVPGQVERYDSVYYAANAPAPRCHRARRYTRTGCQCGQPDVCQLNLTCVTRNTAGGTWPALGLTQLSSARQERR